MKIRLAILEDNAQYLNRIVNVFNTKYSDKVEVYSFTDQKAAIHTVCTQKIDVLLSNEIFEINPEELPNRCAFAYFTDSADIESIRGQQAICRFQRIDLIYKQILSIFSEKAEDIIGIRADDSSTRILSFTSAAGGTGSSTMASACALSLAQKGLKILYLNLEMLGNAEMIFSGEGQYDFTDVIYALKSRKSNLGLKLESIVRKDQSGVCFYAPAKVALDIKELGAEDIERLLKELTFSGIYDYIVLDIDFSIDDKFLQIWKRSHSLIFVSDGSKIANWKFERAFTALGILENQNDQVRIDRFCILYNKFSNKTGKVIQGVDIKDLGGIPRYEHATTKQVVEQVKKLNIFTNSF